MTGVTFTTTTDAPGSGRLRDSHARLSTGHFITVVAARFSDRVELGLQGDLLQSYMLFTAEQARAVAAELLACANAVQGRA